jgi:pimeloyl-ACP methyl ester carboxylesterase
MTFVLVHGAWGGGWNWDLVRPSLEGDGSRVLAPGLLGLGDGDRVSAEIGLDDHIDQVCDLLVAEDVSGAVLVGHSYGGMVITGVTARCPERVARLVYVDAFVPEPGQAPCDILPFLPEVFAQLAVDGVSRPPDLGELFGLSEEQLRWIGDRMRPMPQRSATDAIGEYDPRLLDEREPCFVLCLARPDFADSARALEARGWGVVRLNTHHYPMISMPETVARACAGDCGERTGGDAS